ncbi:MAG: hypothetical protein JXB05_18820 [Myxococcaceae bacterium]|nr:hypothetical protein [Myxococcaceae bacterium]
MSLQVVFSREVMLTADVLAHMLRECHPSLAQARVEIRTGMLGPGEGQFGQMARVQWERHTVHVVFFNTPAPAEMMEHTTEFALYEEELKAQARRHVAHAILGYQGEELDPLAQYVALAKIAVALIPLGAIVVLNAGAFTSYPAEQLLPRPGEELDEVLNTLPLMALFVGFARVGVRGEEGMWIRTSGAPLLDMPDLAIHVRDYRESQRVFLIFKNIFAAMRSSGVRFSAGDMVEDEETHWKFRKPRANEGVLHSERMIVLEPTNLKVWLP